VVLFAGCLTYSGADAQTYVSSFGVPSFSITGGFSGPSWIAFDSSSNTYVADSTNSRIIKFNSSGRYLGRFGSAGSGNGQFGEPQGIAVDSSGNIYVVDKPNNRVEKFDSSFNYLSQFGSSGTGNGQFNNPRGITIDGTGNIYVVDQLNARVQIFNSSGVYQSQFGSSGSGNGQFSTPTGIALYGGNIYVTDQGNNRVQVFNSSGVYQSQFGSAGVGNGQFNGPRGIALDSSGNIFVVDWSNSRVQKFDSSGTYQSQFGSSGAGNGQFGSPFGLAINASNVIFVADQSNNRVEVFNSSGVYQSQLSSSSPGNGELFSNSFIARDSSGNIYVTDRGNCRIQKFDSNGNYLSQFGTCGSGNGQFAIGGASPNGMAFDSAGNLFVADNGNRRVQKFNSSGVYQSQFGTSGSGNGQFSAPRGLAIDSSDNIYVVDLNLQRVQKFNSSGVYVSQFGTNGTGDGQFTSPVGIALDSSGNIYVSDLSANRIQKFSSSGTYLSKFGTTGTGNGQLSSPYALAIDSGGNIFVTENDTNGRIQMFAPDGTYLSKFGAYGSGAGQFATSQGIILDGAGKIYVSDGANDRVEIWSITTPDSPTGVTSSPGNGIATITFSAPASNGGATITSYTATASPGGATGTCTGPNACTITVSGLNNGTTYTFSVTATNSIGTGSAATSSSAVTSSTPAPAPPSFLGTGTNGATVAIKIVVTPPSATTGASGGTSAATGTATATLPAGVFVAAPGALTFSLGVSSTSTGTAPAASGKTGTLSISLPVAGSSSTSGSTSSTSTQPAVSVAFNVETRTFTFTAPPTIRSGSRPSARTKSANAIIRAASNAPAAPANQVTAPSALAISTTLSLTGTDAGGNSGTIQIPVTLYAPAEIGDLVAASTDLYGNFGTSGSVSPALSRDGQVVSFLSSAANFGILQSSGFNQVMRYSVPIGTVDFMSQNTFIGSLGGSAPYGGDTFAPALSADGLILAFSSDAKNIYPIYPAPNGRQIYLTPANAAISTLGSPSPVPVALNGNAVAGTMDMPALSSDGTIIAFESDYNWAPGVSTASRQIYVKNQTNGTYRLASATSAGIPGNGTSNHASISDDGRFVLFDSDATNLVSTAGPATARQIYLKDMANGNLTLISAGLDARPGNAISANGKLSGIVPYSGQGMSAVFESDATNLVQNAVTGRQVYRRDITSQVTSLVSANSTGTAIGGSNATLSGDGRFVAYKSIGTPVGKASASGAAQIYVFDAYANKTALISTDANGLPANAASDMPAISGDGRTIAFASLATNLDGTSTNGVWQIYLAANPIALPLANGFWVNPNQSGYYAIEQSGNRVWFATFGYANDNGPIWTFASESAIANNSFTGNLLQVAGGPPLSGGTGSPYIAANLGSTSLSLSGQTQALLSQANTSSTIQRNDFISGGASLGQSPGYPETGWWYAPTSGQSLFLEVQGTTLMAHLASYDASGKAVWYQITGTMTAPNAYSGTVNLCPNGAPIVGCSNAGAISLGFNSPLAGTITLPGNTKPTQIQRWRF
jgi:DNA-binding beta-propeller fold protein YncE